MALLRASVKLFLNALIIVLPSFRALILLIGFDVCDDLVATGRPGMPLRPNTILDVPKGEPAIDHDLFVLTGDQSGNVGSEKPPGLYQLVRNVPQSIFCFGVDRLDGGFR